MPLVSAMLKAIHAQESREAAQEKAMKVVEELQAMRLQKAADLVERCIDETFAY
jgi:putative transposase